MREQDESHARSTRTSNSSSCTLTPRGIATLGRVQHAPLGSRSEPARVGRQRQPEHGRCWLAAASGMVREKQVVHAGQLQWASN